MRFGLCTGKGWVESGSRGGGDVGDLGGCVE